MFLDEVLSYISIKLSRTFVPRYEHAAKSYKKKCNQFGVFSCRYGRIFKSHLFGSPTIVSCDHEFNLFILQNEEKLFQVSYPKSMQGILGKYSLIIATGEIHKKLRSFAVSFIGTSKSTPEFFHLAENMSISMMDSWKSCKPVSFYKEAKEVYSTFSSLITW